MNYNIYQNNVFNNLFMYRFKNINNFKITPVFNAINIYKKFIHFTLNYINYINTNFKKYFIYNSINIYFNKFLKNSYFYFFHKNRLLVYKNYISLIIFYNTSYSLKKISNKLKYLNKRELNTNIKISAYILKKNFFLKNFLILCF